jgi:hypothetical protein
VEGPADQAIEGSQGLLTTGAGGGVQRRLPGGKALLRLLDFLERRATPTLLKQRLMP